ASAVSGVSPGFIAFQMAPPPSTIGLLTTASLLTSCAKAEKEKQSTIALKQYFFIRASPYCYRSTHLSRTSTTTTGLDKKSEDPFARRPVSCQAHHLGCIDSNAVRVRGFRGERLFPAIQRRGRNAMVPQG